MTASAPKITALVCTYNRAALLREVFFSLTNQTLSRDDFEVVVIDDGSTDGTRDVVQSFVDRLPIRYFHQANSGLAAAKNHGIAVANSPIVVFMDDDDIAMPTLLEEHLKTHLVNPRDEVAVLGYTDLAEDIRSIPLMHFVTEVGCYLFSYPSLKDGQHLDYTYFWGGRSSCKAALLKQHGVFDPVFRFGCEDIELGYRLSKVDLDVIFNKAAASRMIRALTIDDFFNRLVRQGESQYVFSQLHPAQEIQRWTQVMDAEENWVRVEPAHQQILDSARHLDKLVRNYIAEGLTVDEYTTALLHRAYWHSFDVCKWKGITSQMLSHDT